MLDTVRMAYRRASHRDSGVSLLERVLTSSRESIADLAVASVRTVLDYLGLVRDLVPSSRTYSNEHLKGQDRVLDICRKENADVYLNAVGGVGLYQARSFAVQGCDLKFLRSQLPEYFQGTGQFVPGLSILDVIMHCACEEVAGMLAQYDLLDSEGGDGQSAHRHGRIGA
jgi:hypothetical protein